MKRPYILRNHAKYVAAYSSIKSAQEAAGRLMLTHWDITDMTTREVICAAETVPATVES